MSRLLLIFTLALTLVVSRGQDVVEEGNVPDYTVLSNGATEEAVDGDNPFAVASDSGMNDKCSNIGEGNVPFFLVNTQEPKEVVLLALEELPGNIELFLTDQAWNGNQLQDDVENEGTVLMTTPKQGISEGELFGYGPQAAYGDRWIKERGTFSPGTDGDNIFLYCKDSLNKIRFLSAFSNFGEWSPPMVSMYATNSSALPQSLLNTTVTLPHMDNYHYSGIHHTRVSVLRRSTRDASEWTGSDVERFNVGAAPDQIKSAATTLLGLACSNILVFILSLTTWVA